MKNRIFYFGTCCVAVLLALALAGYATAGTPQKSQSGFSDPDHLASIPVKHLLPPKNSKNPADINIRKGILAIQKGHYKKASKEFNKALRTDPASAHFQFLNGLAYHLMAENGNANQYEQAKIGYDLALKFNPDYWLASQQLGHIHLARKKYALAQNYFSHALLHQPDDSDSLYGLAQASYHAKDLQTALQVIIRAKELSPKSARITGAHALISAAAGRLGEAKVQLSDYNKAEPNKNRVVRLADKVGKWEDLHSTATDQMNKNILEIGPSVSTGPAPVEPAPPDDAPVDEVDEEKMVILDVAMIRTEEFQTTNKGVNLLEGLLIQFSGDKSFIDTWQTDTPKTYQNVLTRTIALPEINYNMNIFNAADDRNEILARPTLIALNGKTSTFFAGSTLDVAITGTEEGDLKTIEVGVTLEVTPTFLPSGRIMLDITAGRSFFEVGAAGTFKESIRSSKNTVTASVVMIPNQTLIMSGLREKQTTETKTGVPILRDIPIIQYIFSNEKTMDFNKSVVILISPRRPHPGVDGSPEPELVRAIRNEPPYLKEYRERFGHMFKKTTVIENIWQNLSNYKVFRELYHTGTFDKRWWGERESLNMVLRRTLSFLYY
ncbi:tetratricopeptide repeat protein [Elusimicrobiota bacterium]